MSWIFLTSVFQIFSLPEGVYQTEYEPELNHLEQSFTAMNTLDNNDNFENNDDSDDCDEVKNNFDIEALVDECFVNHPSSVELHSWKPMNRNYYPIISATDSLCTLYIIE